MELMVVKEFTFDSAHLLPNYEGLCGFLHGHTYRLQVGVSGSVDPKTGMVVDFKELSQTVESFIISKLDHKYLNELTDGPFIKGFPWNMPTAENMVEWIYERLSSAFNISLIRLWETPTSFVTWTKK